MSKEYKCFSMELAGRTLTVDINACSKAGKWCCIYALWRYHMYCVQQLPLKNQEKELISSL